MGWKKIKVDGGIAYTASSDDSVYHFLKDITIKDLNDPDRDFSFTKHPDYILETTPQDAEAQLPPGIYTIRADMSWDPPLLYPLNPSHDGNLFTLEVVSNVIEDFKRFIDNRETYKSLGMLHKRGALLYGPPGTGKTSAIQMILKNIMPKDSIALYVTKNISVSLIDELKREPRLKIIIFEELVHAVKDDTLQRFLTFLDGENSLDNCYVLATSNYPEMLPGNIIDRPGRFDKLFQIDYLSTEDRKTYLTHLLNRKPTKEELQATKALSIAAIKEMVLSILTQGISIKEAKARITAHQRLVRDNFKKSKELGFLSDDDDE